MSDKQCTARLYTKCVDVASCAKHVFLFASIWTLFETYKPNDGASAPQLRPTPALCFLLALLQVLSGKSRLAARELHGAVRDCANTSACNQICCAARTARVRNWLTAWRTDILESCQFLSYSKNFLHFMPRSFTSLLHNSSPFLLVLNQTHLVHSLSSPSPLPLLLILKPILILSSHLHPCFASRLFPSGFLTKNVYAFLLSPIWTTCPNILTAVPIMSPSAPSPRPL